VYIPSKLAPNPIVRYGDSYRYAFTSDTEPDSAPWINKNVAQVILLLPLPFVAFAAAVSFAPEGVVVVILLNAGAK
jgi:hypothetical protein